MSNSNTINERYSRTVYTDQIDSIPAAQMTPCLVHDSPVLTGSPAGAGKTTAIVVGVDYLIETGQATADDILITTFNRSAARELREEFQTQRPDIFADLTIRTLHQQAHRLLQAGGVGATPADIPLDYEIADGTTAAELRAHAAAEVEGVTAGELENMVLSLKAAGIRVDPVDMAGLDVGHTPVDQPVKPATELELGPAFQRLFTAFQKGFEKITAKHLVPGDTSPDTKSEIEAGLDKIVALAAEFESETTARTRVEELATGYVAVISDVCESLTAYVEDHWAKSDSTPAIAAVPALMFDADNPTGRLGCEDPTLPTSYPAGHEFANVCDELLWLQEALPAYHAYEATRQEANLVDFQDLSYYAATAAAARPDLYRGRYDAVFVDEAQDVNLVDFWLVSLLGDRNVAFLGDTSQTVNEFRGGDRELFDPGFESSYESVASGFLDTNYRSRKPIVEFSDAFRGTIGAESSHDTAANRARANTTETTEDSNQ